MSNPQYVRYEVKQFLLAYRCPSCNCAELRCIGLDVKQEHTPYKHECPACKYTELMDRSYPTLAYEQERS